MSELLLLGCSASKNTEPGELPALLRYDGPIYRDLRSHLRAVVWPSQLDVAVLSAEFGLIGALAWIPDYERRMCPRRAAELAPGLAPIIRGWTKNYRRIRICLGKDYLAALPLDLLRNWGGAELFEGPIGFKRQQLGSYLRDLRPISREPHQHVHAGRLRYLLPDWDDVLDPGFDFARDCFSGLKAERGEVHCAKLMRPERIADGILVSLAQAQPTHGKGPLKFVGGLESGTLKPIDLRAHYGLDPTQFLFGDCGAFSYVNEHKPPISVKRAVALYNLYNLDYGASVDHIPVAAIKQGDRKVSLSPVERRRRVAITRDNAAAFIAEAKRQRASFTPLGTVQGLDPKDYATMALDYAGMGYKWIALGGLVPLSDKSILEIVDAVFAALGGARVETQIHLFGVFRPKLQSHFRELGVSSFDSATYFRKAWLRSEQNYLAVDGSWYGAIRIPMTSDARTRSLLLRSQVDISKLERLEARALTAIHEFDQERTSLTAALDAIKGYDRCLARSSEQHSDLYARYRRTLEDKPWRYCPCPICRTIGIDVVIFRGCNRNKRRGAHNTWMLYKSILPTLEHTKASETH